jgi:integrase
MTNALRPSELFAFRWKRFDYAALTLTVAETVYKGKIRDWGKTKKSLTVIHIPRQLAHDLQAWRLEVAARCEAKAGEAFSKGKRASAALSPDNFIFETRMEDSSTPATIASASSTKSHAISSCQN